MFYRSNEIEYLDSFLIILNKNMESVQGLLNQTDYLERVVLTEKHKLKGVLFDTDEEYTHLLTLIHEKIKENNHILSIVTVPFDNGIGTYSNKVKYSFFFKIINWLKSKL